MAGPGPKGTGAAGGVLIAVRSQLGLQSRKELAPARALAAVVDLPVGKLTAVGLYLDVKAKLGRTNKDLLAVTGTWVSSYVRPWL